MRKIQINEVTREEFDEIADFVGVGCSPYIAACTVYYTGTNRRGCMSIEFEPGHSKEEKEIIRKVAEILAK